MIRVDNGKHVGKNMRLRVREEDRRKAHALAEADWLGAHDPVSAPTLGNVVATDLPPHVFSHWERR